METMSQAFTAVTTETGVTIGMATENIRGYYLLDNMPEFKTYAEADAVAEEFNSKMGLSKLDAFKIVASTMR